MPSAALLSGTHCLITFACYIHNYLVYERSLAGIIDTQMDIMTSLKTGKAYKDIRKNIRLYKANPLNEYGSGTRARAFSHQSLGF